MMLVSRQSRLEAEALGYSILSTSVYDAASNTVLSLQHDIVKCTGLFTPPDEVNEAHTAIGPGLRDEDFTDVFATEHSPLSRLALDPHSASSVTSLVVSANGLRYELGPVCDLNDRMVEHMFSALKDFRALKELKLTVVNTHFHNYSRYIWGSAGKLHEPRLIQLVLCEQPSPDPSETCKRWSCYNLSAGLTRVDDVKWKLKDVDTGPTIEFVYLDRTEDP